MGVVSDFQLRFFFLNKGELGKGHRRREAVRQAELCGDHRGKKRGRCFCLCSQRGSGPHGGKPGDGAHIPCMGFGERLPFYSAVKPYLVNFLFDGAVCSLGKVFHRFFYFQGAACDFQETQPGSLIIVAHQIHPGGKCIFPPGWQGQVYKPPQQGIHARPFQG